MCLPARKRFGKAARPPEDLRIVRPGVRLAHDLVHGIVAYAPTAVAADVGALSVGRLPSLASKIAILKGADTWVTALVFDEATAAAYGLPVSVVPTRDPIVDPIVIAIRVGVARLAVHARVRRKV